MIEIESIADLPEKVTSADVTAEVQRYPRQFVMMEDYQGWAVYAASDARRRTPHRRTWISSLLDLAALLTMVTEHERPAMHALPVMACVEGRV